MQSQLQSQGMQQRHMMVNQTPQMPGRHLSSPELMSGLPPGMGLHGGQPQQVFGLENQHGWPMQGLEAALNATGMDNTSQDDNWSSSSRSGPTAPTTLNVEDWYVCIRDA